MTSSVLESNNGALTSMLATPNVVVQVVWNNTLDTSSSNNNKAELDSSSRAKVDKHNREIIADKEDQEQNHLATTPQLPSYSHTETEHDLVVAADDGDGGGRVVETNENQQQPLDNQTISAVFADNLVRQQQKQATCTATNPSFSIKVPSTTEEWDHYYDLRYRILRAPWNQPRGSEKDSTEDQGFHFMAVQDQDDNKKVLGVIRLDICTDDTIHGKLRFMAVDHDAQGRGIGTRLVQHLHMFAKKHGIQRLSTQAREVAVAFYSKMGYRVEERTHLLYQSIQHYRMVKDL